MVEKYKLNLAVGFTILLITIWLIAAKKVWDWTGNLLLLGSIALIMWTLLLREKKQAKLLEFFIKSLVVSYAATGIIWFVRLRISSPSYYAYLDLELLMNQLIIVLLLSLFPVAFAVIIYGILRIKLKPWEVFLSSWYASFALIIIASSIWSALQPPPPPGEFYYSSIAGAMAFVLELVFLSLLIAGFFTIVYGRLKKPKIEPPP